jgi:hypothetical protein
VELVDLVRDSKCINNKEIHLVVWVSEALVALEISAASEEASKISMMTLEVLVASEVVEPEVDLALFRASQVVVQVQPQ